MYTNCKNCGAPLHYGKNEYESIAKCKYCNTEYHIDRLGKIEEYKVKLEVYGQIRQYYISQIDFEPIVNACRSITGEMHTEIIDTKTKIKLIEY